MVYRCRKPAGHERERGNEQCEAQAEEYVYKEPNWRSIFEEARPALEWIVMNEDKLGGETVEIARKVLVRAYLATSQRSGVVKA